jgi:hypothetical protein
MEVVQIDLAGGLKFVEEVEQTKREGSAQPPPGGREPPDTKQLDTRWGTRTITFTVGNVDGVDTGDVEQGEGDGGRWYSAGASPVVAKVENNAKVFERYAYKMCPSPTLRKISFCATE